MDGPEGQLRRTIVLLDGRVIPGDSSRWDLGELGMLAGRNGAVWGRGGRRGCGWRSVRRRWQRVWPRASCGLRAATTLAATRVEGASLVRWAMDIMKCHVTLSSLHYM